MQENTPITDAPLDSEDALGENLKLLILHKAFNEIVDGENPGNKEEARE